MSRRSRVTSSNGNPAESLESRLLFAIPEPNDTFDHAYTPPDNIYLETIYYPQDSVHNTADRSDFYKFYNLYGKSNLYLALSTTGSASGEDVDLYVWDANRNLIKAGYSSFGSESFTVDLPANQYFYVEVRKFSGVSANYSLYLQNDYAGSTLATARDIGASQGQSGDRSGLYAQTGFFEVMDYRDATDVYKFRMEAPGTVSLRQPPATAGGVPLSTSVQLLDASGNVLANGVRSGGATSIDRVTLNTGTYYARIQQLDGSGTFNFRIVSDYAGDTAGTARNLGDLTNQSRRMFDMVGGPGLPVSYTDELDLYKFTFNKAAPLDLVLDIPDSFTAPTFDADLFLGRDLNGNGFIESGEIINTAATTSDDELHYSSLNAGTYYVGVRQCGAYTSYQLDLDSDFDAPLGSAAGYKDMSDAQSLGALVGQTDFNGGFGVSFGDSSDFYKFTLAATAVVKVGAARNGFYSRDEVTPYVTILRDGNGNFLYDTTEKIAAGAGGATATLPPGTYYVAIQGYGQANYYGQITADAAGNTLAAARAFAAVSGATPATQTFKDYVEQDFGAGSDPNDFYTFTLPSTYAVTLKTTGVAGEDSALALIRDANNNGTIDSGDVLATANVANSSNETITRTLTAGKYFARFSGVNGGTNYTLAASFASGAGGTPDPDDAIGEIATGSGNNKSLGQFADFSINPADDVDLVKFTVAAGQKVGFDVDSRDGSALDTVLRLFNAGGTQLASNDNGAAPGEPASNFSYLTHTFAAAGTYFIGVSNKGNAAYNPTTGGGDAAGTGPLGAYRLYLNNLGITPA
ncbi:MAG TPA: DVUA0089 family protein, partial [Tepidisphaeraceae bacterium]|nr:DVUA0089 family protein [Tepidisphaeraceae bacterium]